MTQYNKAKTNSEIQLEIDNIHNGFHLIGDYVNNHTNILVTDELGIIYSVIPKVFIYKKKLPRFSNCLNKSQLFQYKANLYHNYKYIYESDNIHDLKSEVSIICKKHGRFYQRAADHINGSNCPKCANEKRGWTYSKWVEASLDSSYFESYKVYIVRCWNDNEEFYKIGKTFVPIIKRLGSGSTKAFPYNYEVEKVIVGTALDTCRLERDLHSINSKYEYVPGMEFNGDTECFYKYEFKK